MNTEMDGVGMPYVRVTGETGDDRLALVRVQENDLLTVVLVHHAIGLELLQEGEHELQQEHRCTGADREYDDLDWHRGEDRGAEHCDGNGLA